MQEVIDIFNRVFNIEFSLDYQCLASFFPFNVKPAIGFSIAKKRGYFLYITPFAILIGGFFTHIHELRPGD